MPLVSTADLYAVARAIPEATPMEMAEAVVQRCDASVLGPCRLMIQIQIQRYDLDDKVKNCLYRRLAAITFIRMAVRSELYAVCCQSAN